MLWVRDRPLLGVPRTWRARRWPVFLLLAPSLCALCQTLCSTTLRHRLGQPSIAWGRCILSPEACNDSISRDIQLETQV